MNEHQQAAWITRLLPEIYNIKFCAEAILLSGVELLLIFNQNTHLRCLGGEGGGGTLLAKGLYNVSSPPVYFQQIITARYLQKICNSFSYSVSVTSQADMCPGRSTASCNMQNPKPAEKCTKF